MRHECTCGGVFADDYEFLKHLDDKHPILLSQAIMTERDS